MRKAIKNFHQQFAYKPRVENAAELKPASKFLVVGMGGSHLAADLLKAWNPALDVLVHSDYGLPALTAAELRDRLIIFSSYSGNTEEVISAFEEAKKRHLSCAAVSVGGKLLELAETHKLPYIKLPDTGIQPRSALGFTLVALLTLMREPRAAAEVGRLAFELDPAALERSGRALAKKLKGFVPVIYASSRNLPIAYNWKIKFNETGKVPAFCNALPELNHNEMTGFDVKDGTKALSKNFHFLLLEDAHDHPKVKKRMQVLAKLYRDRSLRVDSIKLTDAGSAFHKIFSSLVLADWAAYHTALLHGVEPEQVPMVEEFKKLIA